MRKTLAFRPAGQFEVTLGSAAEAFRLRCQARYLSPRTCEWYDQEGEGRAPGLRPGPDAALIRVKRRDRV